MDTKCDICDKSFTRKNHRNAHRAALHPSATPLYNCSEIGCNVGFSFPLQLTAHVKSAHCNDYKCCGHDFKNITAWNGHQLACHVSFEDKLTHSSIQTDESYLPKIYFLIHMSGTYFKIGSTNRPMSQRLSNLKSRYGEEMFVSKSWNMSKKFEQKIVIERPEKELHVLMPQHGFQQKEKKIEYFWFNNNKELEEKWIQYFIGMIVEQHEAKEALLLLDTVVVEHVERKTEKCKREKIENPTERQLKNRERCKKWRLNNKGTWLYCASNGAGIVKVGHTSIPPVERLRIFNRNFSKHGIFTIIQKFHLGDNYKDENPRLHLEGQVIEEMSICFSRIDGTREHFVCSSDDHKKVIEIIEKVIKNNN